MYTMTAAIISVITPVFNGQRFIVETVESVLRLSQGFPIEYIVVNDGSTDSTLEILRQYQGELKIITTENQGESSAVNTGIKNASGSIILVVSADDPLMTSSIFENVVEYFENNPSAVVLYSDWQLIDEHGSVIEYKFPGSYSDYELIGSFHCQPGPGTFFRRSAALQIGGRSNRWKFVGDYDFWLRMSRAGEFGYRREVLAQWRSHDESTSISLRGPLMAIERILVIEEFTKTYSLPIKLKRQALSSAYVCASQLSYFSREVPGKRYLYKAFVSARTWPKKASFKLVAFVLLTPFSRWGIRSLKLLAYK
jgi:glycosyltransferase involved in cell wall biosynthesis